MACFLWHTVVFAPFAEGNGSITVPDLIYLWEWVLAEATASPTGTYLLIQLLTLPPLPPLYGSRNPFVRGSRPPGNRPSRPQVPRVPRQLSGSGRQKSASRYTPDFIMFRNEVARRPTGQSFLTGQTGQSDRSNSKPGTTSTRCTGSRCRARRSKNSLRVPRCPSTSSLPRS